MSAPIIKIKICVKKVTVEQTALQKQLLDLIKLRFRLLWSDSLEAFQKTNNDRVYPGINDFPFTPEEVQQAEKFADELLMDHIKTLPRDVVNHLVFRQATGKLYPNGDKILIEYGIIDNNWDYKGAKKLMDSLSIELLQTKIILQTELLQSVIVCQIVMWNIGYQLADCDVEELKPYCVSGVTK